MVVVQVVHEFVGYTTSAWAMAAYRILVVLTGGFIWMLGQYIPQTTLWTMQQCPLSKAEYVHAKVIDYPAVKCMLCWSCTCCY